MKPVCFSSEFYIVRTRLCCHFEQQKSILYVYKLYDRPCDGIVHQQTVHGVLASMIRHGLFECEGTPLRERSPVSYFALLVLASA